MKIVNRCMSPKKTVVIWSQFVFKLFAVFKAGSFESDLDKKLWNFMLLFVNKKGTLQRQLWKERSGFKLLNFLNQEIEELGQKSVVNSYKPEFRVIKFQRCSIFPSIHCIHQIIRDPANYVTSYIIVKYSCIAQIIVHLFWPMKCTFLFEFLNLAQLCCCRTLRY